MDVTRVRITLRGIMGSELDCRVVDVTDKTLSQINQAVVDIALNCIFACGDTITIEERFEP